MANTRDKQRQQAAQYMKDRKKKNSYTQGGKRGYFFGYPDNKPGNTTQKGYSDCSSAVRKAILEASGIDIGSNTSVQINNRKTKGKVIHETTGYYPDKSLLKVGDCLYFKGNESHPLDVGHVEMYIGDGKLSGHGSGTGPREIDMMDYCKSRATKKRRYFMTIRWIPDEEVKLTDAPSELKEGMYNNPYVLLLQQNLKELGYQLDTDGDFGSETERILKAFQEKYGLPETGVADAATLKKMDEALNGLAGDTDEEPLPVPIVDGVTIAPGKWNVRTGPGSDFKSAGYVQGGTVLEKVDLDGWTPVMFNGELRFIGPAAVKK